MRWAVILALGGATFGHEIRLAARTCRPVSTVQRKLVPADWSRFQRFVRACAIRDERGVERLTLLTVSAEAYYRSLPGATAEQVDLPKARLYARDGRFAGELPYAFPDDPPVELEVTFLEWEKGMPRRIGLYLRDPAAGGDRRLPPLRWKAEAQIFEQEK